MRSKVENLEFYKTKVAEIKRTTRYKAAGNRKIIKIKLDQFRITGICKEIKYTKR